MRIGTSMWGFRNDDIASVLRYCAEVGISSIEAQVHPQAPGHFRPDTSDSELQSVMRLAAEVGVSFDSLSIANDFTVPTERMAGEMERALAAIGLARRMNVRQVRVFAGFRNAAEVTGDVFNAMVDALRALARQAAALGVRLALENHGGITGRAEDVLKILHSVGHFAGMGCLYDPVNFVRSGQDALTALRQLGQHVVYTHAKDLTTDNAVCAVGQGVLPWKAILAELAPEFLVVIEQTDSATVRELTAQSAAAIRSYCHMEVNA